MRPASVFATAMAKFQSDVTIDFNSNKINAKSLLNIIAACIKCGSEFVVECNGPDEEEALAKAKEIVADKITGTIVKEIYVPGKIINIVCK